jgi:glycosyltransferase involved in cell wall biosynthesis
MLRVVAVMEASTVTGPAKNLIEFFKAASRPSEADLPVLDPLVVTFVRGAGLSDPNGVRNAFLRALDAAEIRSQVVQERFRFDPRSVAGLREAVRSHTPDVVQTHSVKSHFLARIAGLHRMFPWIGFHHGYTSTDLKMELYNRFDRWSLPHARRVITVCKPFADQMAARGVRLDRMSILHNFVRLPGPIGQAEVERLRKSLGLPEEVPVVLCVGRFSREKGHADLIAAAAELRDLWPRSYSLVLVGDGPERHNLEQRVRSLGLTQNVVFAGYVANVSTFYGLASVMALPSHSEGSPNVVLEAMAHGVPIAATAVGGVPEILQHDETGVLVPPHDSKAMATAIRALLADSPRAQQLAAAARRRVAEFTPEAYRRSMLNLYLQVLG